MNISELISILKNTLETHGDLPVMVPILGNPVHLDDPMDVTVLDGDNNEPDYFQPLIHPRGLYLYIGGQD